MAQGESATASGERTAARSGSPWQLFVLALCVFALAELAVTSAVPLDEEARSILDTADFVVCGLFLVDFLVSFARAENRLRYMLTWGWLDLLSSIPALPWMRWGRAGRVVRILRVLRGIRAARMLTGLLLHRRAESAVFGTLLLFLLVLVVGSVSVLQFEGEAEANIRTAEDALWWAFVTMTTVGYGDRYPVTTEGRIVAAVLMSAGVGLFGTFSGLIASYVLRHGEQDSQETAAAERTEEAARLAAIESELRSLRKLLESRAGQTPVPEESQREG